MIATFDIIGSAGDEAEAEGVENAIFAAKTLVAEGNRTAEVFLGDFPVGEARERDGGIIFISLQGVLKSLGH